MTKPWWDIRISDFLNINKIMIVLIFNHSQDNMHNASTIRSSTLFYNRRTWYYFYGIIQSLSLLDCIFKF